MQKCILQYLIERNPFIKGSSELRSIHTREIAKETVDVDNAKSKEEAIISSMEGKDF